MNNIINPKDQSIGAWNSGILPFIVASQLNTLTPVGTAITMVADVKYARVSTSIPTVNM